MGKLGNSFSYVERYLEAVNEVDDVELRNKLNYDLCFYGIYGMLPDDASAMSPLFIKSVQALIEGSHKFNEEQKEKGKKGGRPSAVSDEEITGAIIEFYKGHKKLPSNTELGGMVGLTGGAVRQREPWKNKDAIIAAYIKENENEEESVKYNTFGF